MRDFFHVGGLVIAGGGVVEAVGEAREKEREREREREVRFSPTTVKHLRGKAGHVCIDYAAPAHSTLPPLVRPHA